jgi:hypothetical protein
MSPAPITKCSFCSDVEGNLDHFERYIQHSTVLTWTDHDRKCLEFQDDDTMFVYGGDSQDKGIGDIRFVKMLLDLKTRYPERVQMIIGNRDGNKIRLCSELTPECIEDKNVLIDKEYPYWESESNRKNTPQVFLDQNGFTNTAPNRLKWILKHSMGAEGAFDRRRNELSIIGNCEKEAITEDAVVQSYRDECDPQSPDNFMLQYLRAAKIAYVFGATIFVHGALNAQNIGTVPGKENVETHLPTWVDSLNKWAQKELAAFENNPYEGKTSRSRAGDGLTNYGSGEKGNGGRTVTSADFLKDGNSHPLPVVVQQYMLDSNINTVLSGHKPHGDCPNVICTGQVKAISADTSYSQMGAASDWGVDNRGTHCVSEVIVDLRGVCTVRGKLADGTVFGYTVGGKGSDEFVGHQLEDKSWIKAKITGAPEYVACLGKGYALTPSRKTAAELAATRFVAPETRRETLYRIDRPHLLHTGPRSYADSDWAHTGDVVEEYWCGVKIRKGVPAHTKSDVHGSLTDIPNAESTVPVRIPAAIKRGVWKFKKTGMNEDEQDQWEWRQEGDWDIYSETLSDDPARHDSKVVALLSQLIANEKARTV